MKLRDVRYNQQFKFANKIWQLVHDSSRVCTRAHSRGTEVLVELPSRSYRIWLAWNEEVEVIEPEPEIETPDPAGTKLATLDNQFSNCKIELTIDSFGGGEIRISTKATYDDWSEATVVYGKGWSHDALLKFAYLAEELVGMPIGQATLDAMGE